MIDVDFSRRMNSILKEDPENRIHVISDISVLICETKRILKTRAKLQNQDSDDVKAGGEILDLQILTGCFY